MMVKRITVRVSPELHQQLVELGDKQLKSLNTLAVEALQAYAAQGAAETTQFPLQELQELLTPAAEAAHLTEEELFSHAREIRRRIWQEMYSLSARIPLMPPFSLRPLLPNQILS